MTYKIINGKCEIELKNIPDNSIDSIVTDPPYELGATGKRVSKIYGDRPCLDDPNYQPHITKGTSEWEGWGTALKPAVEPIVIARKHLSEKTVAENCLKWGVGGINIDGCRVGTGAKKWSEPKGGIFHESKDNGAVLEDNQLGRFPANLIHDGSDEVVSLFPNTKVGARKAGQLRHRKDGDINFNRNTYTIKDYPASEGSASRFFYCAKASKSERNNGINEIKEYEYRGNGFSSHISNTKNPRANNHPTVKPISLMRYLCKLITPKNGTVLDPFMGSGTTGIASKLENLNFIGIESEKEYCELSQKRIENTKIEKIKVKTNFF